MTLTKDNVESRVSANKLPDQAFVDNAFCDTSDGDIFDAINPETDKNLCAVAYCTSADVEKAVVATRRSFGDGGYNRSGSLSREHGTEAMDHYFQTRTIWTSRGNRV